MTTMPNEEPLLRVLDEAGSMAARAGEPYTSGHLLLALLTLDNAARGLLADRFGLTVSQVAEQMHRLNDEDAEPADMLNQIRARCQRMARSCGAQEVGTLHLVLVLSSIKESLAYRVLAATETNLGSLRTVSLALVTGGPRRRDHVTRPAAPAASVEPAANAPPPQPAETEEPVNTGPTATDAPLSPRAARIRERSRNDPRVTRRTPTTNEAAPPSTASDEYSLDEEVYPTVATLGRNLSLLAQQGRLEPLVGRRRLVERVLDILGKRRANNPCLVGEPGVGKTAVLQGLAYLQANEPTSVSPLAGRVLVQLNMGSLLAGTAMRGSFSERIAALRQEVEQADGHIVIFLDEIHNLVGAGAVGDGALDAVGELSAAMAQGSFPCIGATTTDNYKKYIEETPALQRRLQPVLVAEPTREQAMEILRGVMPAYARHHAVVYLPEAFEAAVGLSTRYIADRFLPDKAISLMDLAGSRARRQDRREVGRTDVAQLVADSADIPVDRLLMADTERFLRMEDFVHRRIVGHGDEVSRICRVIRRNYAGFASNRPIGSFLLLGPTGVGKTETVKVLADFLFQCRDALARLDMSEFQEPHSVARLIGSPPGYVGHDQGGQLTEAVRRRPYQIVLLDEIEKAHRDVLQVLLQLLDDGRLTDGRGRTVDFSNTVVVMTSNLGSDHYDRRRGPIGFGAGDNDPGDDDDWPRVAEEVLTTARRAFPIELWNRIEERLVFRPLTREQVVKVAKLLVGESSQRLCAEKGITFEATDEALRHLVEHGGYDPLLGARPMRTTIQRLVEAPVAEQILRGTVKRGDTLRIGLDDGTLTVERKEEQP